MNKTDKEQEIQAELEDSKDIDTETIFSNDTEEEMIRENETGNLNDNLDDNIIKPGKSSSSSSKSTHSNHGMISSLAGAVAAVAAVVVVLSSSLFANIKATFQNFDIFGTYVNYTLAIAFEYTVDDGAEVNFDSIDTGLRLIVHNNDFSKTVELKTGLELGYTINMVKDDDNKKSIEIIFTGTIEGLKSKYRYKFEVIGEDSGNVKTYATKDVKTVGLISEFRNLSYQCQCSVDGFLYYTLDYIDESNYYKDFTYKIIRMADEEVIYDGEIINPREKQRIDVSTYIGKKYKLIIKYYSTDPDDGNGNAGVEIEKMFEITI